MHRLGSAEQNLAGPHHEDHVVGPGVQDRVVVAPGRGVEDREVADTARGEGADRRAGGGQRGGALRRHLPELFLAEMGIEVVAIPAVGAAELPQHVHRPGRRPIGGERDLDPACGGHARGIAVEPDVRARGPDQAGAAPLHRLEVLGLVGEALAEGALGPRQVLAAAERAARAEELIVRDDVDSLADDGELGRDGLDRRGRRDVGIAAARAELRFFRVAERKRVAAVGREAEALIGGAVQIADQPGRAPAARDGGRTGDQLAQLGPPELTRGRSAGRVEPRVSALVRTPVVALFITLPGVDGGGV